VSDLIANAEWHHFLLAACGVAFLGGFLKGARVGYEQWMLSAAFVVAAVAIFRCGFLVAIGIFVAANLVANMLGFIVGFHVTGGRRGRDGPIS